MNQLLLDGHSLVGIVASIIRQTELHVAYNRMDWERIYRIADYHKVANIVYLGILGYRESVPPKWQERFFARYQESLLYGENYKSSIDEMLSWLDTRNISCTVLLSEGVRELYPIAEAADTAPLQICLDEKNYTLVKGYLIDLGYETFQDYDGQGECLKREQGIAVTLYHKLPFRTGKYVRGMQKILESACIREPYTYVRMLPMENEFIYRMAAAAYRYATDELTMREVLDLQLCHRAWRDQIRMDVVSRRLAEYEADDLAEKILRFSYMWFGDRKDTYYDHLPEDMSPYDVLEERLLTRGMIKHETNEQALKIEHLVRKELDKERREEKRQQRKARSKERWNRWMRAFRWAFPDFHYMASIYPVVERFPPALPVFWIIRGTRLLIRALKG